MEEIKVQKNKKNFQDLQIERSNDNKIKISWTLTTDLTKVDIYWSKVPSMIGEIEHIATVEGVDSAIFADPDLQQRTFFIVKAKGYCSEMIAEVIMPFAGVSNFRDLGGYKTKDGRRVKWNLFFRSGELAGVTEKDLGYLKGLGVKTILDYRSQGEVLAKPDPIIEELENINISGMPSIDQHQGNFDMMGLLRESKDLAILKHPCDFLKKGYIEMVSSNHAFKKMLECVADPTRLPMIQHCTAGKDRTGFGAALLLLMLGVPEEQVIEDYLLTNRYRLEVNHSLLKKIAPLLQSEENNRQFKLLIEARREYIESSLQTIKEKYGSVDCYLAEEYGLDEKKRQTLQSYYLE